MADELERTLVFIAHQGQDKYGSIIMDAGIARYAVGQLQRRAKGQGDYYVSVFDRHGQTREEVIIPKTAIDAASEKEQGEYSALVARANELAPSLDIAQQSQIAVSKKEGPSVFRKFWDSKPMRDLKYATALWGFVGSLVGAVGYGGITGYRLAATGDIEEMTRKVAEDRTGYNYGRQPSEVSNFNSRVDELERAEKALEDGIISKEDLMRLGLGDFKKVFDFGTQKLEYRSNKSPVGDKDIYFYSLCDLVTECDSEISERETLIPKTEYLGRKVFELINDNNLDETEKSYLSNVLKSLIERRTDAVVNSNVRIDASCLGNEVANTIRKYREFMSEQKANGYFDKLVNKKVNNEIGGLSVDKFAGSFFGGMVGAAAWLGLLGFVASRIEKREKRKKAEEGAQNYQI